MEIPFDVRNHANAMDNVMPQSSTFFKDSGLWSYWKDENDFMQGKDPYLDQTCSESFSDFIKRIINKLIQEEKDRNDPEPLVTIDAAIYLRPEDLQLNNTNYDKST